MPPDAPPRRHGPLGRCPLGRPHRRWCGEKGSAPGGLLSRGPRRGLGGAPGPRGSASVGRPQVEVTWPLGLAAVAASWAAAAVAALLLSCWGVGLARAVGKRGSHRHGVTAASRALTVLPPSPASVRGFGPPRLHATLPQRREQTRTGVAGKAARRTWLTLGCPSGRP